MKISFSFRAHSLIALALLAAVPGHAELGVSWITHFGGSGTDYGWAITVDAGSQSWVAGFTDGSLEGTNAGAYDGYLSRLSPTGGVDFIDQRGGTGDDATYGVALVGSGTVFAGGYTSSSLLDGTSPLGGTDAFTMRYGVNGAWQATARLGSSSNDYGEGLAGNATQLLVAGSSAGSFNGQTNQGTGDAFLSKRDSTGALVWTRFVGTTSPFDNGKAAAFDTAGNAYLAGITYGSLTGFVNAGGYDFFVARYDSAGNQTLLKQIGIPGFDLAYDMEVDGSGNIYLTGATEGDLGGQTHSEGSFNAFLMKLDATGNILWTRLLGGTGSEVSRSLALDGAGHIWIGGESSSTIGSHATLGDPDAFVAQYDTAGNLIDTLWLASSGGETINGLAIGPDGTAYVTGYTTGALGGPNAGSYDVFVAKIVPEPGSAVLVLTGAGAGLLLRRRRA